MTWNVINGNNIDILKTYPDNYFDSIVTDPPYGIEFLGKDWDKNTGPIETWKECLRVLKPGGYLLAFSAARTYHRLATNIEDVGFEIKDQLMWIYASGFPKAQDVGKMIDKRNGMKIEKVEFSIDEMEKVDDFIYRNKKNNKIYRRLPNINGGKIMSGIDGKGYLNNLYEELYEKNNEWSGWKTALKPAHEPIVMARKPFKGNTVDNVLQYGTGALNIDESRVEYQDAADLEQTKGWSNKAKGKADYKYFDGNTDNSKSDYDQVNTFNTEGRYPSNVIGEVSGYEKYFYQPKVSRTERHIGFENESIPAPFGDVKGAYVDGKRMAKIADDTQYAASGNNHPTVKPVELMKYLVRLVTPPNGTVLDPFNGSGSTGMACVELKMNYVGCELDEAYVEIANKRIAAWEKKFDNPTHNLLDFDE